MATYYAEFENGTDGDGWEKPQEGKDVTIPENESFGLPVVVRHWVKGPNGETHYEYTYHPNGYIEAEPIQIEFDYFEVPAK